MKKSLLTLFCLTAFVLTGFSQAFPVVCGQDLFSKKIRETHPDLYDAFNKTFEDALSTKSSRGNDPLIVNIVVHIVWKEEAENLDDSIILDQVRILNEDYNKLNVDLENLRPFFQPEAGSAGIEFRLAQIVSVHTETEFAVDLGGESLLPEVKSTVLGGSTAWDPEKYINIWVCKIQPIEIFGIEVGQLLGFAFPPNNLPNWPENSGAPQWGEDGVVIDYRVFGSNNPNPVTIPGGGANLVVEGRTVVHELGHYFGLRHIWGDGGILGPNDCAQSDGINDTPFANAQSSFDCDKTRNSCTEVEEYYGEDVPDLIENFMDYASEDCMNMFTNDQVVLMRNILEGPRSGLLNPLSSTQPPLVYDSYHLVPNPAQSEFTIAFENSTQADFSIRVLNAEGKVVLSRKKETFYPGRNAIQFRDISLSPGVYFVNILWDGDARTQKLIIR